MIQRAPVREYELCITLGGDGEPHAAFRFAIPAQAVPTLLTHCLRDEPDQLLKTLVHHYLRGFENVRGPDGIALPCSAQNLFETLTPAEQAELMGLVLERIHGEWLAE
jgi:hypothetical protein